MTFSEFVKDILKFTCPRYDCSNTQDVQSERLPTFEPGLCVVSGLLRCHSPGGITFQAWGTKTQKSFGPLKALGEKLST